MPNDILQFAFCAEVRKLVTHHLTPTCMQTKLNSEVRFWLSSQHSEMTVSFKFQLNVIFTRRTADNKTATEKQVHFSYFLKGKKNSRDHAVTQESMKVYHGGDLKTACIASHTATCLAHWVCSLVGGDVSILTAANEPHQTFIFHLWTRPHLLWQPLKNMVPNRLLG